MWIIQSNYNDIETFYSSLNTELHSLIEGEKNLIANMANISSWIYHAMPDLNWAGFYLWDENDQELVLGPFQGKPACIRIKPTRGVCGASYKDNKVMRVDDVHSFAGHIACDGDSRSELVIPLVKNNKVIAILDLDSPKIARFSEKDEAGLTLIMKKIADIIL